MKASIINIGDELLIGQVVNTNASWMAEQLNLADINVEQIIVAADTEQSITNNIIRCTKETDIIIISGGLGPTKDDITKSTLCKFFNDTLIDHEPTRLHVKEYFKTRNLPMLDVNRGQSMVPSRCKVLLNPVGSAPGMWFEENGKIIISLPGVPFEMKYIMTEHVIPSLKSINKDSAVVHKTILTCGIGESFLADSIAQWEDALPPHIKLAYLPNRGQVRLRISARGKNHDALEQEVKQQLDKLTPLIQEYIFGYDDDDLITVIGKILKKQKATISTAESCTAGNISAMITSVSGASEFYAGSIIGYSNTIKEKALNVPEQTINQFGAVSEQTAIAMARGCLSNMRTDYAIATTGISGPRGETEGKPIGLVYIAIASKNHIQCKRYCFKTTRIEHQLRSAKQAIFDLWTFLRECH